MQKSQAPREWAMESGVSIREAECWLDAKLFLDWILLVGHWGASLPHHPARYVPTCHWGGMKGSREVHLLRLLAKPTQSGSQGKLVCHKTGGLSDLPVKIPGPIPWGIPAKEGAWPTAMWAPAEGRSYSGHFVLADEPFAEVEGAALQAILPAILPTRGSVQVLWEEKPTWWGPSRGQ